MAKSSHELGELKEKAIRLIALHIGDVTAAMYRELYRKRNVDFMLNSVTNLMVELLGREKAERELVRVALTHKE